MLLKKVMHFPIYTREKTYASSYVCVCVFLYVCVCLNNHEAGPKEIGIKSLHLGN